MITHLLSLLTLAQLLGGPGSLEAWHHPPKRTVAPPPFAATFAAYAKRIPSDPGTVTNVIWNGAELVDAEGLAWAPVGTVPQVDQGVRNTYRAGAGPFSDTNNYTMGIADGGGDGGDALDFASDFSVAAVFYATDVTTAQVIFSDGYNTGSAGTGWWLKVSGGNGFFCVGISSGETCVNGGALTAGEVSVLHGGRSGPNIFAKSDLGANVGAAAAMVTDSTTPARIGRYQTAGYSASGVIMLQAWASTTAPTDGLFVANTNSIFGVVADTGQVLVDTRSQGLATYVEASSLYLVREPPNRLRIDGAGAHFDNRGPDTTHGGNRTVSPEALGGASWTPFHATRGATASERGVSLTKLTSTVADGQVYQLTAAMTSSATPVTVSGWAGPDTGTGHGFVSGECSALPSTCTCTVIPPYAGTCTATASVVDCIVAAPNVAAGSPVRVSATFTCAAATAYYETGGPGTLYSESGEVAHVGGLMLQRSSYPSSFTNSASITSEVLDFVDTGSAVKPIAAGYLTTTVVPDFASTEAGVDVPAYSNAGGTLSLVWSNSAHAWTFTAGGVSAASTAQTFTRYTSQRIRGDWTNSGHVCIQVDKQAQACSAGPQTPFVVGTLHLGGDGTSNLGGVIASASAQFPIQNTVVVEGDSTSAVGSPNWPTALGSNLGASWTVTGDGVSGTSTTQILGRWTTTNRRLHNRYVFMLGGVNDSDATTAIANLHTIYDQALADGFKPVPMTITPLKGSVGYDSTAQTRLDTVNADIVAYAAAHGLPYIDTNALMNGAAVGTDPLSYAAVCNSGDFKHESTAGAAAIASAAYYLITTGITQPSVAHPATGCL